MSINAQFKTLFLLGAGSSLPANLPNMPKMTKIFFEHMDTLRTILSPITVLSLSYPYRYVISLNEHQGSTIWSNWENTSK